MRIERYDRQPDPRIEEIARDGWRSWADAHGYRCTGVYDMPKEILPADRVHVEQWEQGDGQAFLLYVPNIPYTSGAESLYLLSTQREVEARLEELRKIIIMAALLVEDHRLRYREFQA